MKLPSPSLPLMGHSRGPIPTSKGCRLPPHHWGCFHGSHWPLLLSLDCRRSSKGKLWTANSSHSRHRRVLSCHPTRKRATRSGMRPPVLRASRAPSVPSGAARGWPSKLPWLTPRAEITQPGSRHPPLQKCLQLLY